MGSVPAVRVLCRIRTLKASFYNEAGNRYTTITVILCTENVKKIG